MKRITDSSLTINDNGISRRFHIECQSSTDGSIIIRMFEYDAQIALNDARNNWESGNLYVKFPESGILYLRSTENTLDYITTTIEVPGSKTVSYNIPTLKISDYSAEDIVAKKLYFLVPFFFFNLERYFDQMEKCNETIISKVMQQIDILATALLKAQENGELKETELMSIAAMFKKVLEHLTVGYEKVRKEVFDKMGGTVLDYPAKTAYRDGINKAVEQYIRSEMKKGLSREEAEAKASFIFTEDDEENS